MRIRLSCRIALICARFFSSSFCASTLRRRVAVAVLLSLVFARDLRPPPEAIRNETLPPPLSNKMREWWVHVGLICIPLVAVYLHIPPPQLSPSLQKWHNAGEAFHFRGRDIFYRGRRTSMNAIGAAASHPTSTDTSADSRWIVITYSMTRCHQSPQSRPQWGKEQPHACPSRFLFSLSSSKPRFLRRSGKLRCRHSAPRLPHLQLRLEQGVHRTRSAAK